MPCVFVLVLIPLVAALEFDATDEVAVVQTQLLTEHPTGQPYVADTSNSQADDVTKSINAGEGKDLHTQVDIALLKSNSSSNATLEEAPIERPRLDQATVVEFGILWKNFFGIDTAANTFEVDVILYTTWEDARTEALIPQGATSIRFGTETAAKNMWRPKVRVTNAEKKGVEIVSTSFLITQLKRRANGIETLSAKVEKMERALVKIKGGFAYDAFPFDHQDLIIRIASETYMTKELVLVPVEDSTLWGAEAKMIPSGWEFKNASVYSFVDVDGSFSKSRGALQVHVKRLPRTYISNVFIPSTMLFVMAQTSLWLPLAPPFVMPRVALNAIALLAQVTLAIRVNQLTPPDAYTYMDDYIEAIFSLQFIALVLNAVALSMYHKYDDQEHAKVLDQELLWVFPASWSVSMVALSVGAFLNVRPCLISRIVLTLGATFYYVIRLRHKLFPDEEEERKDRRASMY